ncbi:winged helix-turn-helix transcriptional regulator [Streptomyces sp. NPDC056500]|uniref:winged helix-turn-helix transcriptional regulator n=1 Tax=Streptomyces sp. NPDC056500 TaxID=3345840 RepID=UPI0036AB54A2
MRSQSDSATNALEDADDWLIGEQQSEMEACRQVHEILGVIGDKWTLIVMGQLRDGSLRFGELQRAAEGVSQRMLTLTLRRLERDGLLVRTVHASVPPRVEYALTEVGSALLAPAAALGQWASAHRTRISDSRSRYDARPPG